MAINVNKARDYVYQNGVLWERALFGYLFDNRPYAHVLQCLLAYKNSDGGFGHALEHDLRAPDSHPAALEYLLSALVFLELAPENLLDGAAKWLEDQLETDGFLKNPRCLRDYPLMPWWDEWGGQRLPDSIIGNLTYLGKVTPKLAKVGRRWVEQNLTLEKVKSNEWLFMTYHAYDYFMHVSDFPDVETYRKATIENILNCAKNAPEKQYYVFFRFAPTPNAPVANAAPQGFVNSLLDYLMDSQQDDGHWDDEHGLPQWLATTTINNLLTLKRYGRWK